MNLPIAPHLDPLLSKPGELVTGFSYHERQLFGNDHVVSRKTLEQIEETLEKAREEFASRAEKIAVLTEMIENLEAYRHLTNSTHHLCESHVRKLQAETAQRDRLAMAIRGLERAIAWRKANPDRG